MGRFIRRIVAAGGVVAGLLGVAEPASTSPQQAAPSVGDFEVSPTPATIGEAITVTPVDLCPMPESEGGVLDWEFIGVTGNDPSAEDFVLEYLEEGSAPIAADGSWEITFTAPSSLTYEGYGILIHGCQDADGTLTLGYWNPWPIDIVEPGEPPTTQPPGPLTPRSPRPEPGSPAGSPAPAVPGTPGFTG